MALPGTMSPDQIQTDSQVDPPVRQPEPALVRPSGEYGGGGVDDGTIRAFLLNDYARVVAAVTLASGSRAAAEDAVQEALVRAWTRTERGEQIESLAVWVASDTLGSWGQPWVRFLASRGG